MKRLFSKALLLACLFMLLISSCLFHARGEGANGNTLSNIQRKAVVHTMYEYKDEMQLPFENIESVVCLSTRNVSKRALKM